MSEYCPRVVLSLNEAAIIAQLPEGFLRDEVDAGIVPRKFVSGSLGLGVTPREILYARVVRDLPVRPDKAGRAALFRLIARGAKEATDEYDVRKIGTVLRIRRRDSLLEIQVDTKPSLDSVIKRMRMYWHGRNSIEMRPDVLGGEPVFKGTRVSVRHVGELIRKGVPLEELRSEFPHLKPEAFEFASLFAERARPRGRPRKPIELKPSGR